MKEIVKVSSAGTDVCWTKLNAYAVMGQPNWMLSAVIVAVISAVGGSMCTATLFAISRATTFQEAMLAWLGFFLGFGCTTCLCLGALYTRELMVCKRERCVLKKHNLVGRTVWSSIVAVSPSDRIVVRYIFDGEYRRSNCKISLKKGKRYVNLTSLAVKGKVTGFGDEFVKELADLLGLEVEMLKPWGYSSWFY